MFNPHTSSGSWGGGWVRSLSPLPTPGTRSSLPSPALLPPTWEARLLSEDARGSPAPTASKCRCVHHLSMWLLQGAAGAQGFAEGKRQGREFGSEGRRPGEAERGAFAVAVALGSPGPPATQPEEGAGLSPCGPAVSLLSTHQLSPQICSVTHMKRGQCAIFSWSSWPGLMAFRPGPLEAREAEAPRYSPALAGGQGWSLANV